MTAGSHRLLQWVDVQDPQSNSKLYNRDNEYLHYQDDWYAASPVFAVVHMHAMRAVSCQVELGNNPQPSASKCRYVVAWKPDEYAFIYYKGNNDAWKGYGGTL